MRLFILLLGLTPQASNVFRLRNNRELESFLEEVSGLTGKKELLSIYKVATEDEYSFLYVNLAACKVSEMFFNNFTGRIVLEDVSNDWYLYLTIIITTIHFKMNNVNGQSTRPSSAPLGCEYSILNIAAMLVEVFRKLVPLPFKVSLYELPSPDTIPIQVAPSG